MAELPEEKRYVAEGFGCGCLAAESSIDVADACYAGDGGMEDPADKPLSHRRQLEKVRTAPLIRSGSH